MPYTIGLHHLHKRKRIHQKHEEFPHPDKFKRFVDKSMIVIGILGPLFALPQVFKIWIQHNATGVSIITWLALAIIAAYWAMYGFLHKDKPIIITFILWVILDILIVIGALIW